MQATVSGERWRLRFRYYRDKKEKGVTVCSVERSIGQSWILAAGSNTTCGRLDRFCKEQGRQFAMARALRLALPNKVRGALITAYVRSGRRQLCADLQAKGFTSLYDTVFNNKLKV